MDRQLISRNLMNILNAKESYRYDIFSHDDLYEQLNTYISSLSDDSEIIQTGQNIISKNKTVIDNIINDTITLDALNPFLEELRQYKRIYFMNKEY